MYYGKCIYGKLLWQMHLCRMYYGKCIYGKYTTENVFTANVLWKMYYDKCTIGKCTMTNIIAGSPFYEQT